MNQPLPDIGKASRKRKRGSSPGGGDLTLDDATPVLLETLTETNPLPKNGVRGRNRDKITYKFAIPCWHRHTSKPYWRCAAPKCKKVYAGPPQKFRVLNHAENCPHVALSDRDEVLREQAKSAPSAKLKKNLADTLDKDLVLLVCREGLIPRILRTQTWKDFMFHSNPRYKQPSVDTVTRKLIPAEAAHVWLEQEAEIRKLRNLTLTFDGHGIRNHQSVYTVHVTAPNGKVYLLAGENGTGRIHNTKFVFDTIKKWATQVGVGRIAAIGSDSTAVTKNARRDFVERYPFLINFGDPCHHLDLTIKDLSRIPKLKEGLQIVKSIVAFFGKSDLATVALRDLRKDLNLARGLERVGKTRFGTHYWAALSVQRNLDPIRTLVRQGKVTFGIHKDKDELIDTFMLDHGFNNFKLTNQRYLDIIEPLARTIECFESTNINFADIFIFWAAIAASLRELLAKPIDETKISLEMAHQIRQLFNRRYKAFIDSSPSDMYYTAFFLDPRYRRSDILQRPSTMSETILIDRSSSTLGKKMDGTTIPVPQAYERAKSCLEAMLLAEEKVDENGLPLLQKIGGATFFEELKTQFLAYACGKSPFKKPWNEERGTLGWWESLEKDEDARCLAALAIKIYSVVPHSMADERTMSTFTWFNSALRNKQDLSTLVNMARIRQWYTMQSSTANNKRHPVVKWRDIDRDLFFCRYEALSMAAESAFDTSGIEGKEGGISVTGGIRDLLEEGPAEYDDGRSGDGSSEADEDDGLHLALPEFINITPPTLKDLLSDKPVDAAHTLHPVNRPQPSTSKAKGPPAREKFDMEHAVGNW